VPIGSSSLFLVFALFAVLLFNFLEFFAVADLFAVISFTLFLTGNSFTNLPFEDFMNIRFGVKLFLERFPTINRNQQSFHILEAAP
jgi:hypothetical protein